MREILFKGKRDNNGKWVYGSLLDFDGNLSQPYIIQNYSCASSQSILELIVHETVAVIPKTVGQYTGLTDKNGMKIFEGDIVKIIGNQSVDDWKDVNYEALIVYINGGFCAIDGTEDNHSGRIYCLARCDFDIEVIGNIHDNPELLKDGEQK